MTAGGFLLREGTTMIDELKFIFEEVEPEYPNAMVPNPQLVVFIQDINTIVVFVYFMANAALKIKGGIAKSAMGKIKLQCLADSPFDAVTASVKLHKVKFTFPAAMGMATNFEFVGQKE